MHTSCHTLKHVFMKLRIFFIPKPKQIYTNAPTVSKKTFKIKTMPRWAVFEILLTSVVICKEKLLHENSEC